MGTFSYTPMPQGIALGLKPEILVSEASSPQLNLNANWQPRSFRGYFFAIPLGILLIHVGGVIALLALWNMDDAILIFDTTNVASWLALELLPLGSLLCSTLLWEIIHTDICRLEPFYQLAQPDGARIIDSLSQDYLTSYLPLVPLKAFRSGYARHTAVILSSIVYLIFQTVLPIIIGAMFKIELTNSYQMITFTLSRASAVIYIIVSMVAVICGITLFWKLRRRQTGLLSDPAGLSGIAALIAESDILAKFQDLRSYDTQKQIDDVLGSYRVCLKYRLEARNPYQICLVNPQDCLHVPREQGYKSSRREAHSWWLWGRTYVGLIVLSIILLVYLGLADKDVLPSSSMSQKIISIVLGVISSSFWTNWLINISTLEPYYRLSTMRRHSVLGSSAALDLSFTGSSIFSLYKAIRARTKSAFIGYISFCVLVLQISVVTNPAILTISAIMILEGYPNLFTFSAISTTGVTQSALIAYYILCFLSIIQSVAFLSGWIMMLVRKRKAFLPRKPYTLSSVILYLCHSSMLLQDTLRTSSLTSEEAKSRDLCSYAGTYGFGWFRKDGGAYAHVGIERIEVIREPFYFGQRIPEDAR